MLLHRSIRLSQAIRIPAYSLLLLCFNGPALAGTWDWGADGSINSVYNSNPTLRKDDDPRKQSTFRVLAVYKMDIEQKSPGSRFRFRPRVTRDYYPDEQFKALESTDFFLPGSATLIRPTTNWNLAFNASRQNVLSNETTIAEGEGTPGSFRADDIQYIFSLAPNVIWFMTPRDQLTLNASAVIVDFDLDYTGRSDYESYSLNTSYRRSVNERQQLGLTAFVTQIESEGINCRINYNADNPTPPVKDPCTIIANPSIVNAVNENETDSNGFTVDYRYNWSETVSLVARIGLQSSDSVLTVNDADGNSIEGEIILLPDGTRIPGPEVEEILSTFESTTYDISFDRKMERYEFTLGAQRRVRPSQLGTPQDRYQLNLDGKYSWTERLLFRYNLIAWEQQSIFLSGVDNDELERKTRFFSGNFRLSWSFHRDWAVNGGYRYRYRDRDEGVNSPNTVTSTSNEFAIGFNYRFRKLKR
jgi:hypothetical protein